MSNINSVTKLEVPTTARSILSVFRASTLAERSSGRDWYHRARKLAEELVREYGTHFSTVESHEDAVKRAAAVIAVISPRLNWNKNVELARWVYAEYSSAQLSAKPSWWVRENGSAIDRFPGLKSNGEKAIKIICGMDPEDIVSGPKVTAFWRTIVDPSDPRAVVVDRHALDVAKGQVLDDRQRGIILGRKGAYEELSALYRRAAKQLTKELGATWTPAEVQAVTWVVWRRNRAAQSAAAQREAL
jgi:hypothetical protein